MCDVNVKLPIQGMWQAELIIQFWQWLSCETIDFASSRKTVDLLKEIVFAQMIFFYSPLCFEDSKIQQHQETQTESSGRICCVQMQNTAVRS